MTKAEEILRKNFYFGADPDSMWEEDIPDLISSMKEYANYVAAQTLKDSAENAKINVESPNGRSYAIFGQFTDPDGDTISIDKESITKTEIKLP